MEDKWIRKMLEATWGFNDKTGQVPSNILRYDLKPIDVEAVEKLVLPTHQWNMPHYEMLMAYFENFDDEAITKRMIAVNRIIISLLKTGTTNEF
tara:strand:+ start:219 stop:500 length:282 start_codon:yes stop_codon:yes gene_type:complete